MNNKDIKRFSFSRFKTYHTCPRKHYYTYVEQVEEPESEALIVGSLWHEAIAAVYDQRPNDVKTICQTFEDACRKGVIKLEPDTLEHVLTQFLIYYAEDFKEEKPLVIEKEITEDLEDGDTLVAIMDLIYKKGIHNTLRDYKTTLNRLKYKMDDVEINQQLLFYVPYGEQLIQEKIDAIEIQEIKIAKLDPVPVNANGKPSTDKRRLANVTYEAFYDYLASIGIEDDPKYQEILDYLEERGHPLFNRVTFQVLDINMIDTNIEDLYATYHAAKNPENKYRVRGPLCNYCGFKELCKLDMFNPNDVDRNAIKDKILMTKPSDDE